MAVDLPPRKRIRPMSQMNVVPYIDVMLVLLIIFMVTAPMLTMGEIEVPSAGTATRTPDKFARVTVSLSNEITLTDATGASSAPISLEQLVTEIKAMQTGNPDMPVIIAADKELSYEKVVHILNTLQQHDVRRVGLLVSK